MRNEETKKYKSAISGVMVVDKPVGKTSHDVVQIIRRGTGLRRIGHTGTLDPRASGVLVVLIGPAVRLSEYLLTDTKRYEAMIRFGATSDTYDADGVIVPSSAPCFELTEDQVLDAMEKFTGEIQQIPPIYSALKVDGKKACDVARRGGSIKLEARDVTIFNFDLVEFNFPEISADIYCSSGTYVRSLAHDLGQELGCGAYLAELRRTLCGQFSLRDAVTLPDLQKSFDEGAWYQYLLPAAEALKGFHEVVLSMEQEALIRTGRRIPAETAEFPLAKAVSEQGELIAILALDSEASEWLPKKVLYP